MSGTRIRLPLPGDLPDSFADLVAARPSGEETQAEQMQRMSALAFVQSGRGPGSGVPAGFSCAGPSDQAKSMDSSPPFAGVVAAITGGLLSIAVLTYSWVSLGQ
jgi:hypothetical protein